MVEVSLIRSEEDYKEALTEIDKLIDCNEGSLEEEKLLILSLLVEAYEEENYPIGMPHLIKIIEFRMEQKKLKLTDLIQLIGEEYSITAVLKRREKLDLPLIRRLSTVFDIPIEILVQDYEI